MIRRTFWRGKPAEAAEPTKGFDAFELHLGDLMRGERATLGKSLLDVQRELKIKAAYIAAIENCDPSAFDTPGFIAGYVRSYARYLNMDPEWAYETFCRESGFTTAHGMSAAASGLKPRDQRLGQRPSGLGRDIFAAPATPFIPTQESFLSRIEPRAVGSVAVLVALIGGIGYGGWTVLQEIQKVSFAPVEQAPMVVAEVDPLAGASRNSGATEEVLAFEAPSPEALDRLYRPQGLDLPELTPRDGPIATLRPEAPVGPVGLPAASPAPVVAAAPVATAALPETPTVRVTDGPVPEVQLVAVRPAWVRVTGADGATLFEGVLEPGQTFAVPATIEPPRLRVGESGALYLAVNGVPHGPVGPRGTVTSNVALSAETIAQTYAVADLTQDQDLAELVNVAEADLSVPVAPETLPAAE